MRSRASNISCRFVQLVLDDVLPSRRIRTRNKSSTAGSNLVDIMFCLWVCRVQHGPALCEKMGRIAPRLFGWAFTTVRPAWVPTLKISDPVVFGIFEYGFLGAVPCCTACASYFVSQPYRDVLLYAWLGPEIFRPAFWHVRLGEVRV